MFVSRGGQRTSRRVGPRDDAEDVATKIRAKLVLGSSIEREKKPPVPTLADYYKTRFKSGYMAVTLKPSTYASYETSFRVHILPELGKYRLDEIGPEKVEQFIAHLCKKTVGGTSRTLSRDSIRLIVSALGRLYNRAKRHKLIVEKGRAA